jgi:protein-tyrosine kinase
MSRVDEALKRARSLRSGETSDAAVGRHTLESPVVPLCQYDRFPLEQHDGAQRPESEDERAPHALAPANSPMTREPGAPARIAARYTSGGVSPNFAEKVIGGQAALASREQYGRVAATLHHTQRQQNTRLVMVTSAVPGEGKTLTAANVALTLSLSYGRRVLLVDADLRNPTLHEVFQVANAKGLLDGLQAGSEEPMSLIEVSSTLSVLPAGRSTVDPMSLLISERMRQMLREASEAFDWVIVDTPPIGMVPDAHVLADIVPAAVFVIKAASTPHDLIAAAVTALGRERILGVVLNCVGDSEVIGGQERYGYGDYSVHQ